MFGLIKNKKLNYECQICGDIYTVALNPSKINNFDYEFLPDAALIGKEECRFCKGIMTIVYLKDSKKLKACDEAWEKYTKEYQLQFDILEKDLKKLYCLLNADKDCKKLEIIIAQFETKLEKLVSFHEKKYNCYERKKETWESKRYKCDQCIQEKLATA